MSWASRIKEKSRLFLKMFIKNKAVTGEKVGPLKFKGENLCLELDNACGVLNEYFASVYTKEKPMKYGEITVEDISLKSRRWWWWVS